VDLLKIRGAARVKKLLAEQQDMAWTSQRLTQIKRDINLSMTQKDSQLQLDMKKVERYFKKLGTGQRLVTRFSKLVN